MTCFLLKCTAELEEQVNTEPTQSKPRPRDFGERKALPKKIQTDKYHTLRIKRKGLSNNIQVELEVVTTVTVI